MGSDEFAVLFPEIDEKGVKRATEKLREYLANKMTQNQTDVTFSMRIACFLTSPQYSAEELVKKAYNLMTQARRQGKAGIVFEMMK